MTSRLQKLLWHAKWGALHSIECALFSLVFPFAVRIGGRTARRIACLIGKLRYHLDIDWRTISLRHHFVRERTLTAMQEILPDAPPEVLDRLVRERFVHSAQEELDAHYFFLDQALVRECSFEGLETVRMAASKTGVIYLTLHLDSAPMAIAQMGRAGLPINFMMSDIVNDARVPPVLRRYFRRKYEGIRSHLRGGQFWPIETNMRDFYRTLKQGEGAVILCEAPAQSQDDSLPIEFLGKIRFFKRGALRLAEKTGAALAGMICLRTGLDRYKIVFSPVYDPAVVGSVNAIQKVYTFLGEAVKSTPERWWAADLLPTYIKAGERH